MAKLLIVYGHPNGPAAFEDHYADRHLPYDAEHMSGVVGDKNQRIVGTADGTTPAYYRMSQVGYGTIEDRRARFQRR
jgi:uncharacterized protein (TIGR02118 family)